MSEEFLTQQGLKKLKEELDHLIKMRRPEIASRIKDAISLGDIMENAEYAEAKEEQAFIEGRVTDIENILRSAKVIPGNHKSTTRVAIGSVLEVESGSQKRKIVLVGKTEANPDRGEISADSPLGRAVLGKAMGEIVSVRTPAGNRKYRITRVA